MLLDDATIDTQVRMRFFEGSEVTFCDDKAIH